MNATVTAMTTTTTAALAITTQNSAGSMYHDLIKNGSDIQREYLDADDLNQDGRSQCGSKFESTVRMLMRSKLWIAGTWRAKS